MMLPDDTSRPIARAVPTALVCLTRWLTYLPHCLSGPALPLLDLHLITGALTHPYGTPGSPSGPLKRLHPNHPCRQRFRRSTSREPGHPNERILSSFFRRSSQSQRAIAHQASTISYETHQLILGKSTLAITRGRREAAAVGFMALFGARYTHAPLLVPSQISWLQVIVLRDDRHRYRDDSSRPHTML